MSVSVTESPPPAVPYYFVKDTLGAGTFGVVRSGQHLLTGESVALKVLEKKNLVEDEDLQRVIKECHIMAGIEPHPHVVNLFEIVETADAILLVLEYAGRGELFNHIVDKGPPEEAMSCKWLHQLLAGVEWVHKHGVCHRDLKLENLLLDDQMNIKVADFGLSNIFKDGEHLQTACGSPCYAAPEMVAGQMYDPEKVDIWSCGVILYVTLAGRLPFDDPNHAQLYRKIMDGEYEIPDHFSEGASDIVRRILNTDPESRLMIEEIRTHPWYQQIPESSLPPTPKDFIDEEALANVPLNSDDALQAIEDVRHGIRNHKTVAYRLFVQQLARKRDMAEEREFRARLRAEARPVAPRDSEAGGRTKFWTKYKRRLREVDKESDSDRTLSPSRPRGPSPLSAVIRGCASV